MVNSVGALAGTLLALSAVAVVRLRKPAIPQEVGPEQVTEELEPDRSR